MVEFIFNIQRFANIFNTNNNSLVSGTDDDDFIDSDGEKVTIKAGKGNDEIDNNSIYSVVNGDEDDDTINNYGEHSTIDGGAGDDYIVNTWTASGYYSSLTGGEGDDTINAPGMYVTVSGGSGNDYVDHTGWSGGIYVYGGGNDTINGYGQGSSFIVIENYKWELTYTGILGDYGTVKIINVLDDKNSVVGTITFSSWDRVCNIVSSMDEVPEVNIINGLTAGVSDNSFIQGTSGRDHIEIAEGDTVDAGADNDYIREDHQSYASINCGAGNDTVLLWFGKRNTVDGGSGNDFVESWDDNLTFTGGKGDDSLFGAGKALIIYNNGDGNDYIEGFESSSRLSISGGTYSTQTSGDDLIVTVGKGNITLAGAAGSNPRIIGEEKNVKSSWTLNGTTAKYGTANNTLITVKGVKSVDGLALNNKFVTVAKSSLNDSKVTISNGYTLKLANDVPKPSTKKAAWTLSGTTATYKSASRMAGYTLASDGKSITYSKATTATTLATVKGVKSTNGLTLSGKKITLKNSALKNKVTIGGGYEFNFASDYKKATITGSKNADTITANGNNLSINGGAGDDTIKFFGTATTVNGGAGKDLFVYKSSNNVIADYAEEDKISIAGTAQVTTSGSDVIFTVGSDKITVKGGKDKNITYVDAGGEHVYPEPNNDVIINGKVITLTEDYLEDSFNVTDYGKALQTINASAVQLDLSITGNKLMNSIVGGNGNDTLNGGGSNDTLTGGEGADIFICKAGDGNNIITDYAEEDKIKITSGTIKSVKKNGNNVIFTVGSNKITVKGAASKTVTYIDAKGKTKYYPTTPASSIIWTNSDTTAILRETYSEGSFIASDYNASIKTIDATAVTHDISIKGNGKANVILGGYEDDTVNGSKGNDTLQGGTGKDVFVYANGDGKDIILDYDEEDMIKITKGTAKITKNGSDVVFTIGSGKMTVKNAADKTITYIEGDKKKTYGSSASFIVDDNDYELTPNLSSLVQSKTVDYSFLNVSTKLRKETNLIAYSGKR